MDYETSRDMLTEHMRKLGKLAAQLQITMEAQAAFSRGVSDWDDAHDARDATMITDTNGDTVTANEQRAYAAAQRFYDMVRGQQRSAPYAPTPRVPYPVTEEIEP